MVLSANIYYQGDSAITAIYQGDVLVWPKYSYSAELQLRRNDSSSTLPRVAYPFGSGATYTHEFSNSTDYYHVYSMEPLKIADSAFSGNGITYIATTGFTELGKYTFAPGVYIKNVVLDNEVKRIDDKCFYGGDFKTINISNVEYIGEYAFRGVGLTSIDLPDSLSIIPHSCFSECRWLTSVTFGSGVTEIGNNAFFGCESAVFSPLPSTIQTIGSSAFAYCSSLTSVVIPNISIINGRTFYHCSSMTAATIPLSVTEIKIDAFTGCLALVTLNFTGTMSQWGSITKGSNWNGGVPATVVHCSDGDVPI